MIRIHKEREIHPLSNLRQPDIGPILQTESTARLLPEVSRRIPPGVLAAFPSSHLPCVFGLQLLDAFLVAQGPNGLIDKGRDSDKDADDALCTNPEQPEPQGAENGYRQERLEIC